MKVIEYEGDVTKLLPLFCEWITESNGEAFGITPDVYAGAADIQGLVDKKNSALFVAEEDGNYVGFIGVQHYKSPIGADLVAQEHYWFVSKKHRGNGSLYLLDAVKNYAIDNDCALLLLSASNLASGMHDKVCSIYERLGMEKFETTYGIRLNDKE